MTPVTFGYHAKLTVPLNDKGWDASRLAVKAVGKRLKDQQLGNGFIQCFDERGIEKSSGTCVSLAKFYPAKPLNRSNSPIIIATADNEGIVQFISRDTDRDLLSDALNRFIHDETDSDIQLEEDLNDPKVNAKNITTFSELYHASRRLWASYNQQRTKLR